MFKNSILKILLPLFLLVFSVYVFFGHEGFQGYENETFGRIWANLENGELKTARSGFVQTILETPFVFAGKALGDLSGGGKSHGYATFLANFYNSFITALTVCVFFLLVSLFVKRKKAVLISLLYAFATMAFPYALIGMDPTAVFLLLASVYFLFRFGKENNRKMLIWSGAFYFLLFFSKAYYFVTLPAFGIYILVTGLQGYRASELQGYRVTGLLSYWVKESLYFFIPLIFIFPLYILANKLNYGVYFGGGYNLANELTGGENPVFGIYGLLLSFGKSLFIYNSVLVLALVFLPQFWAKYKKEAVFLLAYFVMLVLFVSQIHWWSDETWGPRYLLSLCPLLLLPVVMAKKDDFAFGDFKKSLVSSLFIFLIASSFLFQFLGVLARYDVFAFNFYELYKETGYNVLASQEFQYIPQFAPYFVNYQAIKNKMLGINEPLRYKIVYSPPMEEAGKSRGGEVTKEISFDMQKYRNHALDFWWRTREADSLLGKLFLFLTVFTFCFSVWRMYRNF